MPKKSKKLFKGFDHADGRIVPNAYMNGYAFAERLLEGAYFRIHINENGTLTATPTKAAETYMKSSRISIPKWCKVAEEYAEQYDCFAENEDGSGEDLNLIPL